MFVDVLVFLEVLLEATTLLLCEHRSTQHVDTHAEGHAQVEGEAAQRGETHHGVNAGHASGCDAHVNGQFVERSLQYTSFTLPGHHAAQGTGQFAHVTYSVRDIHSVYSSQR